MVRTVAAVLLMGLIALPAAGAAVLFTQDSAVSMPPAQPIRADLPDVHAPAEDTIIEFRIPGATEESLLTRRGHKVAGFIHTPEAAYYVRPFGKKLHLVTDVTNAPVLCYAEGHSPSAEDIAKIADLPSELVELDASALDHSFSFWTGGRYYAAQSVTASARTSRRRAVRSGPSLEQMEFRIGIWYHSRLEKHLGGRENLAVVAQNHVDFWNKVNVNTKGTAVYGTLALLQNIDEVPAFPGITARPDYSEVLMVPEALSRFDDDLAIRQIRFDQKISLATYWDYGSADGGGGNAAGFYGDPTIYTGNSAIGWHEGCLTTSAHEWGHNFGLSHQKAKQTGNVLPRSYAYVNCPLEKRDVMAVATQCFAFILPVYSNRYNVFEGLTVGSDEEDAASVIRSTRAIIRDSWKLSDPAFVNRN